MIGGVAVNLKFSKAAPGNHSADAMMAIIKTYLKRGGYSDYWGIQQAHMEEFACS